MSAAYILLFASSDSVSFTHLMCCARLSSLCKLFHRSHLFPTVALLSLYSSEKLEEKHGAAHTRTLKIRFLSLSQNKLCYAAFLSEGARAFASAIVGGGGGVCWTSHRLARYYLRHTAAASRTHLSPLCNVSETSAASASSSSQWHAHTTTFYLACTTSVSLCLISLLHSCTARSVTEPFLTLCFA